jgi:ABC-type glycerol-3-phosphate transport system permease component
MVATTGRSTQGAPRRRIRTRTAYRVRHAVARVLLYLVLIAGVCVVLVPVTWMLSTSLKELKDVFTFPPQMIPPQPWAWDNYPVALTILPFALYFRNTMIICLTCVVGAVASSALVGFGFARIEFPGRDVLFLMVLGTMMIPGQVTLIPVYMIFKTLGWIDTFLPLTVRSFFGGAFYIFLFRQFFLTIPREMDDAAEIDGCGKLGLFWRVILPLSKAPLGMVAIFSFMFHYDEFLSALIYLNSPEKRTVALGLSAFRVSEQGVGTTSWNLLMAASLVVMVPPLIVFFMAQRYFIQGIVFTGIKG